MHVLRICLCMCEYTCVTLYVCLYVCVEESHSNSWHAQAPPQNVKNPQLQKGVSLSLCFSLIFGVEEISVSRESESRFPCVRRVFN